MFEINDFQYFSSLRSVGNLCTSLTVKGGFAKHNEGRLYMLITLQCFRR